MAARARARYHANPEPHRQRSRAWHEANRRHDQEVANARRRANVERARLVQKIARARRMKAPRIPFTPEQLLAKVAFWGNQCAYCGGPFEAVDHVIALNRGGWHCLANLRPACASCNGRKGDKHHAPFTSVTLKRQWALKSLPGSIASHRSSSAVSGPS